MSGYSPSGPSSVGSKGKSSCDNASEVSNPWSISLVSAALRQAKVSPEVARSAHDGTPPTKFCQSISRRSALNVSDVAWEPDSRIFGAEINLSWLGQEIVKRPYDTPNKHGQRGVKVKDRRHNRTSTFSKRCHLHK